MFTLIVLYTHNNTELSLKVKSVSYNLHAPIWMALFKFASERGGTQKGRVPSEKETGSNPEGNYGQVSSTYFF